MDVFVDGLCVQSKVDKQTKIGVATQRCYRKYEEETSAIRISEDPRVTSGNGDTGLAGAPVLRQPGADGIAVTVLGQAEQRQRG
jgi:hypothetical protein